MQTITLAECNKLLKEKFPNFIPYWEAEISLWGDEGILALFGPFADYAIDVIKTNNPSPIIKPREIPFTSPGETLPKNFL